jgi:hypothetical protein
MSPAISLLTHYKVAVCLEVRDLLHYPWTTPHLFVYPHPSRQCRTFHQYGTDAMHRYLLGIVFLTGKLIKDAVNAPPPFASQGCGSFSIQPRY